MSSENKKKKFNILDLIIIVVLVLALAFVAKKLLHIGETAAPLSTYLVTFYEEECPDFVPTHTQVGDTLMDGKENNYLGTVRDIVVDDSRTYHYDEDTQTSTVSTKDGYCSVVITGEIAGTLTDHGLVVNGELYSPGHTLVLYAGMAKYYLTVFDIQPLE